MAHTGHTLRHPGLLEIERLHPHPQNPRKDLGDLTELTDSLKVNGVLQNLTVVPDTPDDPNTDYTVVIGHRRLAAAKLAELAELPCSVVDMTPSKQIETMLVENMQRNDLTPYEQAQGFQMMLDLGGTISSVAADTGFSETTVRRRVKLLELDPKLTIGATDTKYSSCRVRYPDPSTGKVIEGIAYAEDYKADAKSNQQLEVTAKVASVAEAQALAAKRLRLHNKYDKTVTFTLPGDPDLLAGVTVKLDGWGPWDGKYIIKQSRHTVDASGYETQIQLRRVLEGY